MINFVDRIFDDKFHILHPASLFKPDLKYYRATCGLRGAPVVVAFLDIDDFKTFNTEFGALEVDRNLLPVFMGELEAHLYARGYGYKFGGDEYVVLLPNCSGEAAKTLMVEFQNKLTEVDYVSINRNPTVSIGIFEILDNCNLTDQQSLEKAESAKNKAKKLNGKSGIIIEDA